MPADPAKGTKAGPAWLDGIVHYEYNDKYTYTVGNASKAYGKNKLDQKQGFVRSLLYLPHAGKDGKPVTVVFDAVRPLKALPATFLLHTAEDPVFPATPRYEANGQYTIGYAANQARAMTVRNAKGGMLTVQTLLPENALVRKTGGRDIGNSCSQFYVKDKLPTLPEGASGGDCRFTVRQRQPNGQMAWKNFTAEISTQQTKLDDVGAWRIEISPSQAVLENQAQYFLHVLSVADNDGKSGVTEIDSATRLRAGNLDTEAMLLNETTVLAFNRGTEPAAALSWFASSGKAPSFLAVGLKPNTGYQLNPSPVGAGFQLKLQEVSGGSTYLSSDQGVIYAP
jgi:hypothetical protein